MKSTDSTKPVEDSVPKVDGAVAVGEDLKFQESWWRFEHAVWILFVLILVADVAGVFGRGPVAKAERRTADGMLKVKYERVERAGTPSVMTIELGRGAIQGGKARLFVSQSIVQELGAQRVVPQPETSSLGDGGIIYTFPAMGSTASVQIALEPSFIGRHRFRLGIVGSTKVEGSVVVVP